MADENDTVHYDGTEGGWGSVRGIVETGLRERPSLGARMPESTAASSLFRHKMRSLLTTLGIIIGVAAVIALVAVGNGARAKVASDIASLGQNLLLVFADKVSRSWKQIIYFQPEHKSVPPPAPSEVKMTQPFAIDARTGVVEGAELIEDARGVRIARETDD